MEWAPISLLQVLTILNAPLSLLCCSAVLLGASELGLEPVLSGKEAVASQHRDQPHDLWPVPHAHKAEHRWTQGKDEETQRCLFSTFGLMDVEALLTSLLLALASLRCCTTLLYCSSLLRWLLLCYCSLIRWVFLINVLVKMKNNSTIQKSTKLVFLFKKSLTIMLWALQMKSYRCTNDCVYQTCVSSSCTIWQQLIGKPVTDGLLSNVFPGEINAMISFCLPASNECRVSSGRC